MHVIHFCPFLSLMMSRHKNIFFLSLSLSLRLSLFEQKKRDCFEIESQWLTINKNLVDYRLNNILIGPNRSSLTSRPHRFVVFNSSVMIKGGHIKKPSPFSTVCWCTFKGNEANKLNIWNAASVHRVRQNHLISHSDGSVSRGHYFAYENIFKGADTRISLSVCVSSISILLALPLNRSISPSVSVLFCMKTDFHKIIINRF